MLKIMHIYSITILILINLIKYSIIKLVNILLLNWYNFNLQAIKLIIIHYSSCCYYNIMHITYIQEIMNFITFIIIILKVQFYSFLLKFKDIILIYFNQLYDHIIFMLLNNLYQIIMLIKL